MLSLDDIRIFLKISYQNMTMLLIKKTGALYKKMKFSIKDFFSKCDQIRSFLWIWSHLLMKSLTENFIFYAVDPLVTL